MSDLVSKAQQVKLIIFDVDGVLTSGELYYSNTGEFLKAFNVKDGLGIKLMQKIGLKTAIITSRCSQIVNHRMTELGLDFTFQGQHNKNAAYEKLLLDLKLEPCNVAYMGDDLPDLALIKKSGLGIAVADANHLIKESADWVTQLAGGKGAVREVADFIVAAKNKTEEVLQDFL